MKAGAMSRRAGFKTPDPRPHKIPSLTITENHRGKKNKDIQRVAFLGEAYTYHNKIHLTYSPYKE